MLHWQHVLDLLSGYLLLARTLADDASCSGAWNFSPEPGSVITVEALVQKLIAAWGGGRYVCTEEATRVPESGLLNLDACKARHRLG